MLSRSAANASATATVTARALLRRRTVSSITTAAASGPIAIANYDALLGLIDRRPVELSKMCVHVSARPFSTTGLSLSATALELPTRHSRHLPKPVCTDPAELESTTDSLLASHAGSLFTYEYSSDTKADKAGEYEAGLARSDVTMQKFEWTLGGHAAAIPGTVAAASTGSIAVAAGDTPRHLNAMIGLLERIEEEGRVYVELRARILNRQFGGVDTDISISADTDGSSSSDSSDSNSDSDSDSNFDSDNEAENSTDTAQSASAWRIQSLINRYGAAPGPSIHMYDALLDAIACCAEAESNGQPHMSSLEYLTLARSVYERAMARHHADGGSNANNKITVPTLITHNAVLRICAAVEYNGTDDKVRDVALDLAFVVYDALSSPSFTTSNRVSKDRGIKRSRKAKASATATATATNSGVYIQRNSATYVHMFQIIAKYLPPSSTRGNVAYGLWMSCTGHDGVLDDKVLNAYVEANTRNGSNGKEYDAFVQKLIATSESIGSIQENDMLRQNWWRNRKSRRMSIGGDIIDNY